MRYPRSILGRPQIPPLPGYVVLTDRADGTLWLLTWSNAQANITPDNEGHISISDVIPTTRRAATRVYTAGEEPFLAEIPHRLIVRNGRLGFEYSALPAPDTDRDQALITARKGDARNKVREFKIATGWRDGDALIDAVAWVPRNI